jgi:hypothetical protein
MLQWRDDFFFFFFQIAGDLLENLEKEEFVLVLTMARGIWLRQNTMVFGREFQHSNHIVNYAGEAMEEFHEVNQQNNNKES